MASHRRRSRSEPFLVLACCVVAVAVVAVAAALVLFRNVPTTDYTPASLVAIPTTTTSTTMTTIDPVCEQSAPIDGCPTGTPAAVALALQQAAQAVQAAASAQAEQAYEQCLNNAAESDPAAIAREFGKVSVGGTPTYVEPCSTTGLTPAQIQKAQEAESEP